MIDPDREYTPRELEELATEILKEDAKQNRNIREHPAILFDDHLYHRKKREILADAGTLDGTLTNELSPDGQRMYFRTHPKGRKVNTAEHRKQHGASYYKN